MISQKVLGLIYAELGQSVFSSVATKRNLTDRDITELTQELDSGTHSSEDENTSAQSDSCTDSDTGDSTNTNFTQWTDSTNCQPTVPVVHKFTGGATTSIETSPLSVFMLFFFEIIQLLMKRHIHGVAIKKPDCFYYSFPATSMTKRRVGH